MFRLALAVTGLTVFAVVAPAQDSKPKQGVHRDSSNFFGWVVAVDSDKHVLTILKQDGKQSELTIEDQTKFTLPQGAAMADRLKDRRLTPGTHVKIVMGDGTAAKEVHMLIGGRRAMPAPARAAKKPAIKDISADPKQKEEKKDPGTKEK
jgi:hypothetical protein